MRRANASLLATLALLAGAVARGQEPAPAQIGTAVLDAGGPAELFLPWRFHRGDDSSWADPGAADGDWPIVDPRMPPAGLPVGGWAGTGWFRRHLRVTRAMWGVPLAMRVTAAGSSEVFLDGRPVARFAPSGATATRDVGTPPTIAFSRQSDHVLAVRYTLDDPSPYERLGLDVGFALVLEEPAAVLAVRQAAARRDAAFQAALTVIPLLLAFLHLGLFAFYPKARENLFYATYMLAFALVVFLGAGGFGLLSDQAARFLGSLSIVAAVGAILFGLLTYYALRTRRFPRSWVVFALAAPIPVAVGIAYPGAVAGWCWVPYFAATVVEIVRVEISGRTVAPEGGRILFWGLLVIYGAVAGQALINIGLVPAIEGFGQVYQVAILAAALTMSLFLARSFAHTRLHLERRLEEVESLSGQLLEQERTAHAHELRRRLLEAENARRGAELEAARALQLSMLPPSVPAIAGLEVAVEMTTASEVGGDYYDFRVGADGELVIAVGDATGHGVAAGTMVTAVKALFTTLGGGDLAATLGECDRVLREMNVQPLHMCLALARVSPHRVELSSAAMPPLLIWRARTGAVEELGTGGLPLGGRLAPRYEERAAALEPGDTLLFFTDGFPELLDPAEKGLGFDGAVEAFRASAGGTPKEVLAGLRGKVEAWRGSKELADDITLVAVRGS